MIDDVIHTFFRVSGIAEEEMQFVLQILRTIIVLTIIYMADSIIRDVVASLKQFHAVATKYGVSEQWMGRVET